MDSRNFHRTKKATVAHIRDIPSQNKDSEKCDKDVENNYSGRVSANQMMMRIMFH